MPQRGVEHLRLHAGEVMLEDRLVISREEILRPPPRPLALDHRVDGDVADPELLHRRSLPVFSSSVTGEFSADKPRTSCSAMRFGFPCPPPQIEQKCCLANASSARGQALNKKLKYAAVAIVVFAAAIYINNTNHLATHRDGKPALLAHRGIAQRFDERELKNDTCTAARMLPPSHAYLENTIDSMRAGFAAGADIVELDVHPTTDGEFAVFHDWTLDCRTDGHGVTREHSMAYLKKLDIGHGYTADGGKTFPFRGKGIGLMPTLTEVLATFPQVRLLINVKSRDPSEGEKLAAVLNKLPAERRAQIMVYGGDEPVEIVRQHAHDIRTISRAAIKRCLLGYIGYGWSGVVPRACHNAMVMSDQRRPVDVGLAGPFPQPHEGGQQRGLRARPLSRR